MDKDNERILLANGLVSALNLCSLTRILIRKSWRCCRECRSVRCAGLKGGR